MLPIALQVYSVREDAQNDFFGTLSKIRALGYDGVELAGTYGFSGEEVRGFLNKVGIQAISAHVPYAELTQDRTNTLNKYKIIGCRYIAIPFLDTATRPGSSDFPQVLEKIAEIGGACKELGMDLLYHNHDFEFVIMPDGGYGLDHMYEKVGSNLLATEIDTCWVNVAGEDPVAYVRKYTGRAPVVHLKDFVMDNPRGVDVPRVKFEFRPIGHGCQNMPAILDASVDAGAEWVVVEQDLSVGRTAMEAAKMSVAYLKSVQW